MKSKGERKRHIQLNTDFQRIAQRDKKAFFNEQCIKLEENNRRGKTRDLFRTIEDIKGIFCPKMGTIKNINGRHLGTQKRSRRDGSNTWKICTKKIQMNQITTMVSHQSQTFWITKSSEP